MKIVTIVENNPITGVQYGEVEVPDTTSSSKKSAIQSAVRQIESITKSRVAKIRKNNTKKK